MKRLIWMPVAGFLLVAGAAVAAAAPGLADTARSVFPNQDEGVIGVAHGFAVDVAGDPLLEEVLAELVTAGTITQEQSDAITGELTTRAEERRAEFEAQREEMRAMWTQIKGFLEDGVISADEIAQLPADNPFTNLSDILSDGQVTLDELQSVGPFGGRFSDGPRGGHHGPGGHRGPGLFVPESDGPTDDPSADPNASPGS